MMYVLNMNTAISFDQIIMPSLLEAKILKLKIDV